MLCITLREVVEGLSQIHQDAVIPFGFGALRDSHYHVVTFNRAENIRIAEMRTHAETVLFNRQGGADAICYIAGGNGIDRIGPTMLGLWRFCAEVYEYELVSRGLERFNQRLI